jgi:hypothetical protein
LLNRLTIEAEAWAKAGTPKVNEVALRREPSPHRFRRIDQPHKLRGPTWQVPLRSRTAA